MPEEPGAGQENNEGHLSAGFELGLGNGLLERAAREPQLSAKATATASGYTQIVAAPGAGYRIVLLGFMVSTSAAVNVKFASASTDLTALFYLAANSTGVVTDLSKFVLICAANEALRINLSGTANVGVTVAYRVVPVA